MRIYVKSTTPAPPGSHTLRWASFLENTSPCKETEGKCQGTIYIHCFISVITCRHFYNGYQSNPANSCIARIELPSTINMLIAPCTNSAPHSQTNLKIAFVYLTEGEPKFQRTLQNTLRAGKIMTHIFHNYRIWPRGASSKQTLLAEMN